MAIVNLKKDDVITKLWRKWANYNKKPDCDVIKDEVSLNKLFWQLFFFISTFLLTFGNCFRIL